jgi:glucosamine--fructose-6-phosphate aminotransferase (isomerizing)
VIVKMTEQSQSTALYRSIHAQPQAIRELSQDWEGPEQAAKLLAQSGRILLAGIGTSYHAAIVGEYLLRLAGADAWAVRSFEFVRYPRPLRADDGVIVISHRGSKVHGTMAVQRARDAGVTTIGITGKNTKMQKPDVMIETVEQDPSSAHSISYTAALTRLAQIAIKLAALKGRGEQGQHIQEGLAKVPDLMEDMLSREDRVREVAQEAAAHSRRIYFLGAGPNAATAPEGALKAKEASYVTAEGFELEQAIHGPQVAFEADDLIVPISVKGPAQERVADFLQAMSEIRPHLWLLGDAPTAETAALLGQEGWSHFALVDNADIVEELTPMLAAVPLQLLADFLAAARGTNADLFRADYAQYKRANARIKL